nr:Wzz/FepE/Etk N-terminal domain-containing protein [Natronocella acetinitrilica]
MYELWDVLVRRWWVIVGLTVLAGGLGLAYAAVTPSAYEFRSTIDLARVYDGGGAFKPVESASGVEARLSNHIVPDGRRALSDSLGEVPRVQVTAAGDSRITLTSRTPASRAEDVASLHEAIADQLRDNQQPELQEMIDLRTAPLETSVEDLRTELEAIGDQMEALARGALSRESDETLARFVEMQELQALRRDAASLRRNLNKAQLEITMLAESSRGTSLSAVATQSDEPVGAGRAIILLLSLLLGGMLGVFSAFFIEFVQRANQRR